MADTPRQTTLPLMGDLLQSGHQFSFTQVMRLARSFLDPHGAEGLPEVPWQDRVRIRPELSLAFPAADVARVERDGSHIRVTTTFLGLYGASSPLPNFYTEDLLDEASNDESVIRDFIDIIQQRLYHLYFQGWSKYRLCIRVVEENNPVDQERLLCLIGLGEKELRDAVVESWSLLRYAGLLSQHPRSALGLKTLLRDMLKEQRIRIIQNLKRMVKIPQDQRIRMGVSCCRLGVDTVLGSEIADRMGKIRICIGPLTWEEFNDFLPDTACHEKLARLVRFYLVDPLEAELELVLAAGEARPIRLGDPNAMLGLNTWCYSGGHLGEVSACFRISAFPFTRFSAGEVMCASSAQTGRTLIDCYNEERARLRELTAQFAEEHPNLASLVSGSMADPGVEKLLEGTAFLNALLQRKLDDDIPEFIHEVTLALQPEYLRPVPAATIVAFTPKKELTQPLMISAGAEVASIPVQGTKCRFRTCRDVVVHPLALLDASFSQPSGKAPGIVVQCELNGIGLCAWKTKSLRFYLADDYPAACDLYLLLLRYLKRITVTSHDNGATVEIPPECLKAVGFADNGTIPENETGFLPGHLLLQEYFLFHDKFLFIDLCGLERCAVLGKGSRFEIRFELANRPLVVPRVNEKSFVLSAVPAINLFPHKAKPVTFDSDLQRHKIRPDGKNPSHFQIYSLDQVAGLVKRNSDKIIYDIHSTVPLRTKEGPSCHITQEAAALGVGFETFLSVPYHNEDQGSRVKLDIDLTCTNGILPESLNIGDIRIAGANTPESVCPGNIKSVMAAIIPEVRQNRQWRLFSGFSLNQVSLDIAKNLRAIVRLFINPNSRHQVTVMENMKKVEAIESIEAKPTDRLIGRTICRGYDIRVKLRGDNFAGPGDLYLFSSSLERFLGGYVTRNCYIRLVVEEIGKGYQFEWPARMGDRCVV
jgi:type VI secretion system protein ImpG